MLDILNITSMEIYMEQQPTSFADPLYLDYVCKLKKSLYGLKQPLRM